MLPYTELSFKIPIHFFSAGEHAFYTDSTIMTVKNKHKYTRKGATMSGFHD